ncbi:MAG: EAL domain-containing protein [Xanthobacteraceae bacterium]
MGDAEKVAPSRDTSAPAGADSASAPIDVTGIFKSVGDVPYEWLIESDVLRWGDNVGGVFGITDLTAISTGRAYARLLDPSSPKPRFDAVTQSTVHPDPALGAPFQAKYCIQPHGPAGGKVWIEDVGRWFAGPDGKPQRAHGIVRVINERHAEEEHLEYLSQFDALTGEVNRWRLTAVLTAALDEALKFQQSCGFLLISIDNLARINEAYGYDIADEVIAAVAKRLRVRMRGDDVLGRYSGNKFGVVLKKCTMDDIKVAAERLLAGVRDNVVDTKAGPVAATVTVGGVVAPRHARTVEEILARAQEASNAAKAKRRGSFSAYRPNIERENLRRENLRTSDEIVGALNERRIMIAFEPIVETASRKIAFHECLMRIRRPDGAIVAAQDVIPLAEHLGFVRLLDHRVLELVIAELATSPGVHASLNVSPLSAIDPDWWSALTSLLRLNAGVAERLTIEITETAAIQDIDDTRGFVARVKDLGCRIAIDDFGAGYTSFRNLRKLGVDMIKIDGAFVENMINSEDDRAFVLTLVDLGKRMKLKTVAERVQTEEVARALAACGCDYLQGKLIGLASMERPAIHAAA